VVFTGQMTGQRLSEAFASSDIFLMPSDTETLGFVVLEALASGIPVVGVAAGGLVDIIVDKVTGFLVENNDNMVEFSQAVKKLIQNKELSKAMGGNALEYTQQWSWEAATSKLRNIQYRKALALQKARDEEGKHIEDISKSIMQATFYDE
jgi:sulfoquinovosyltransferase